MAVHDWLTERVATKIQPIQFILIVPLFLLLFILRALVQAYLSPLRSIPGPLFAKFSRFWYLSKVFGGEFEKVNAKLHERYGAFQDANTVSIRI